MKNSLAFIVKNKWWLVGGVFILLLFFFLRLTNLTILPIFADEAIYIRWAQVMKAESTLRFLPLFDGKQPLFMWVSIPFLSFFKDPLWAIRFLSVLSGFASIVGLFLLTWQLFKNKLVSFLTAFTYTILPFFIFFDRLALVDSMLAMLFIWVIYLSLLFVKKPQLDLAMIVGFFLAAALLVKSPAIFLAILLPLSFLFFKTDKEFKDHKIKWVSKILALLGVIYAFGFGIYNFLLRLGPNFHMISLRNKDYLFTFQDILRNPIDPLVPHLKDIAGWLPNLLTWPFLALAIIGILVSLKSKIKPTLFLLACFIIPLLAQSVFARVFTPRYILFTIWPLFVFMGLGLNWFFEQSDRILGKSKLKLKWFLFYLILVLLSLPALSYNRWLLVNPEKAPLPYNLRSGHLEEWTAGQGLRQVADFLKIRAKTNSVFVGTEGSFGTLPDGLQIYLEGIANIRILGVGHPIVDLHSALTNSLVDNEVYLLVNQSRLSIPPEAYNLKLITSFPKAVNSQGYQDSLLFFQLEDKK